MTRGVCCRHGAMWELYRMCASKQLGCAWLSAYIHMQLHACMLWLPLLVKNTVRRERLSPASLVIRLCAKPLPTLFRITSFNTASMYETGHLAETLPNAARPSSRCSHSSLPKPARSSHHHRSRRQMTARATQQLHFEKYEGLGNDFILVSSHALSLINAVIRRSRRSAPDL